MGRWIADTLHERRGERAGRALVLGLTFKENVPDLRNSRSFDLVGRLVELGHDVDVADPLADAAELRTEFGSELKVPGSEKYDLVVGAVAHPHYRDLSNEDLEAMLSPGGTLADIKGMWRDRVFDAPIDRWSL